MMCEYNDVSFDCDVYCNDFISVVSPVCVHSAYDDNTELGAQLLTGFKPAYPVEVEMTFVEGVPFGYMDSVTLVSLSLSSLSLSACSPQSCFRAYCHRT